MMSDAPDVLTLDEVLEQMLPLFDDDPFDVAVWLDDQCRRADIYLVDDGIIVPGDRYKMYLTIVAFVRDKRATLKVKLQGRPFGHVKNYEAIVGHDKSGNPIKVLSESCEPIEQWAVERKSFEVARSNTKRSGRPISKREWVLIESAAYIVEKDLPNPPTADALYNELAGIHGVQCPSRALAMEVLPSLLRRIKDVLGR